MLRKKTYIILFSSFFLLILLFIPFISSTAAPWSKDQVKEYVPIEKIASVKKLEGFSLSPDGKWIAFCSTIAGNPDIWIVSSEGGWPLQLTTSKQRDLAPVWSPDSSKIAYIQDTDGNEVFDIWVTPLSGGEAQNITNSPEIDDRNPCWSPDGKKIAFASDRAGNLDIFIMTAEGKDPVQLSHHSASEVYPKWSPEGKNILFERYVENVDFELLCVAAEGGEEKLLTPYKNFMNRSGEWSPDGSKIAFYSNLKGFFNIGIIDFLTGKISWLTEGKWDSTSPTWSPDGTEIAYTCNVDGQIDIFLIPSEGGEARKLPANTGVNTSPQWFPDGKRLAFIHESSTEPKDIWVCPAEGAEAKQISFSFVGGLNEKALVKSKLIHYTSFDGLKISAYLFKPQEVEEGKKLPAVIWVHGGPNWQFFNFWYPLALGFANQGFVVLCPNFRGGTGYGKEFEEMNDKDWGGNDLKDVVAGADYLIKSGLADAKKIAIAGKSYGGFMTLMALTKTPDIWAAGIAFMGPTNQVTMFRRYRGPSKSILKGEMGTPEDDAELYYDRSPVNFVQNMKAPLLAIYGATDTRVTLTEWQQLKEALDKYNKKHESIVFPDEGHFFGKTENLIHAMKQSVRFLRKYLK